MITRCFVLACATALLGATLLPAQRKVVFPAQAATAEGTLAASDATLGAPWATNSSVNVADHAFRYMLVSDLPAAASGTITHLAFRRDGIVNAGERTQAFQVELRMSLSHAKLTSGALTTTFADAIGNDAVEVLKRQTLIFGTRDFAGSFPETFNFVIPLDKPFVYSAAKGSLCYDLEHYTNTLYNQMHGHGFSVHVDAIQSTRDTATLSNASRCFSPNPWKPAITYTQHLELMVHNNMDMLSFWAERDNAMHHSQGLLVLSTGLATKGIDFDCGTFWIDETRAFHYSVEVSDDLGYVSWPAHASHHGATLFMVPFNAAFIGVKIYGQEANWDVHNLKLSATNWMASQVPTWLGTGVEFGMRGLYATGAGSHTAATGTLGAAGTGPVIEYTIQ
ncbi:MAG: hypothetical protein KDC95_20365 [Planctomycetes bacterium]|nr:hypothetical protein [Planctomycetota bacterium]